MFEIKLKQNRISFYFFIVLFLLYFIPRYIEYTTLADIQAINEIISTLKKFSYVGALLLFSVKSITKAKMHINFGIIVQSIIFIYFAYEGFVKDRNSVFVILCFGMIFEEKYLRDFIRVILYISTFLYIAIVVASLIGIISDVITPFNKLGLMSERHSLGFNYAGQLIMQLVPIVMCYYYLHKDRIKWVDNLVWLLISTIIFLYSKTIMGYMLIFSFIILFNITIRFKNRIISFIINHKRFFCNLPYIICTVTFFLMVLYQHNVAIVGKIDVLMNSRIKLGVIFWEGYGIKLLGTNFTNDTRFYYQILDSDYMYLLIACGIIYTVLALWILKCIMKYMVSKQDIFGCVIWTLLLINSIPNNNLFNLILNPFSIVAFISIGESTQSKHNIMQIKLNE